MFICQATVALTRCVKPDVVENHTQFDTNIYDFVSIGIKQALKSSEDTHFTGYARFEKVWARKALGQKSFEKIHFWKIHF